jgi:probable rRNA maturation factor
MIKIIESNFKVDKDFYLDKLQEIVTELEIEGDIVIKLGDKEESQTLNAQFLQRDYPTDVLSFPFNENIPGEGYYLGDIFICYSMAEEQAKENDVPLEQELFTLMLHGILHLAGYDHESDVGEMQKMQEQILKKFGKHF